MDWFALQQSPLWKALWESEEVKSWTKSQQYALLNGNWDPETRGVLRGQLKALNHMQALVDTNARKQMDEADKQLEAASQGSAGKISRWIPRIL